MELNFKKIRAKGDENPESGPTHLSFSTQVVNKEPIIGIIKAPHGRSTKETVMHPVLVDQVIQLIP